MLWIQTKAILCALWYGILPWCLYERECHYEGWTYRQHLCHNLRYAWGWLTYDITPNYIRHELTIN